MLSPGQGSMPKGLNFSYVSSIKFNTQLLNNTKISQGLMKADIKSGFFDERQVDLF
jgi:hypothetical protein